MARFRRFRKKLGRGRRKRTNRRYRSRNMSKGSTFVHNYVLRTGDLNGQQLLVDGTAGSFQAGNDYYEVQYPTAGAQVPFYVTGGMNFQFRDIDNYQDLQTIYDQYRINKVKIKIIPMSGMATSPQIRWFPGTGTEGVINESLVAILHDAVDINDSVAPLETGFGASVGALRRYKTYKQRHFYGRQHIRYITPNITNDNISLGRRWLNCSTNASQPHYGYKFILELPNLPRELYNITGSTYTFGFKIEYTYFIQFRQPIR